MCTLRHNSITPKALRGIPPGVKLTVHEDFSDISIATVETLRFDETKGMLLTTTLVEGNSEQKEFKYQRNAWLFMFPDPMHGNLVFNSRRIYDLRLSAIQ